MTDIKTNREPEVMTCKYCWESAKKKITRKIIQSHENYRAVAESAANALNFDHISQ